MPRTGSPRRPLDRATQAARLLLLGLPLVTGCASLNAYRAESVILQGRFTTVENYATTAIDVEAVDALLLEVADILGVQLNPAVPRPRVVVTTPDQIARLYSHVAIGASGHLQAVALYFPGSSLVLIPYFDRSLLGHELAHYLTDHYLRAPRSEWESIAHTVEWQLFTGKRRPARLSDATTVPPATVTLAERGAPLTGSHP